MAEEAVNSRNIGELMFIEPEHILVENRKRSEYGDLLDLANDIKENGLYQPLVIRTFNEQEIAAGLNEGKKYKLVAGGRRYMAITMFVGWKRIPTLVRSTMDELYHRIIELNENLKRKQMTWDEEALATQEIMQLRQAIAEQRGEKITQRDIANELKLDAATVSRNLKAAEAIQARPELKKASSRKAAIRANEQADYIERRMSLADVKDEQRRKTIQIFQNDIVTADARDWTRKVMPRSVDLVLTDPPFGINYFKSGHKMIPQGSKGAGLAEYDDTEDTAFDLLADLVPSWVRILRETGWLIVFMGEEGQLYLRSLVSNCCAEHCDYRSGYTGPGSGLPSGSSRCAIALEEQSQVPCRWLKPEPKPWIWYRPNSRNRSRYPEFHPQNVYESIFVCNMGKGRLTGTDYQNLFTVDSDYGPDRIHPHQKPIELAAKLTLMTTYIGDTVVDTTYGSGALLAGAAKVARIVMGCEKNPSLRGPAIGLISKHHIPVPTNAKRDSAKRYEQDMQRKVEGIDDYTEIEEETTV